MEIFQKCHYQFGGEIIRQKTTVMRWLIFYSTVLRNYGVQYVFKGAFFYSRLDFFPEKSEAVNDEHGKWFHLDISTTE